MNAPKGYSAVQIALHWGMAVLIIGQLVFGEDMGSAFRAALQGKVPEMGLTLWGHICGGIAVLLLVTWRLILRAERGAPPPPEGGSALLRKAGQLGHAALYGLMILAPVTGVVAWFGLNRAAGEVHEWLKPAFVLLIAVHVLAALWHQVWLKDGLMLRMRRPLD